MIALMGKLYGRGAIRNTSNFGIGLPVAATLTGRAFSRTVVGRQARADSTSGYEGVVNRHCWPRHRSHANARTRFGGPKHLGLRPTQETLFMDIWVQDVMRRVVDCERNPLNVAFRRSNVGNKPAHGLPLFMLRKSIVSDVLL